MAYVIGAIVIIIILGALGKLLKNVLSFIIGLAFLGGIIFALITFGPVILAGLISILSIIWPFLLWGFLGLLALGILMKLYEKLRSAFKAYPWQTTIIIVTILILSSLLIFKFVF